MDIRKEYARMRAKHPTTAARYALSWARDSIETAARLVALSVPRFMEYGRKQSHELPNGARLVYRIEPDESSDIRERSGVEFEWLRYAPDHSRDMPDWWIDRDGAAFVRGSRGNDMMRVRSDYSIAERVADNRKRGMARHAAWCEARASLAREFDSVREYIEQRETYFVLYVQLLGADGIEIADDVLGGVDSASDYWRDELARMAADMLADYRKQCLASVATNRATLASARKDARRLALELRRMRAFAGRGSIDAPAICEMIAERVAALRSRASMAARAIGAGKRGADMVAGMLP